ncbi:hypothetical protein GF374_02660 [Candidatus Woesearchaeota archaeon]|nr:hypothetical protein [Candidatus Woesearchaeota archaeon]
METEVVDFRPITDCGVYYNKPKEGKILEALEQIYNYSPLRTQSDTKKNAVLTLVDEWFRFKMSRHYKELSPKLFDLQREVTVDLEKHEAYSYGSGDELKGLCKIDIPLFCNARLQDRVWRYIHDGKKYKIDFESGVPFIPDEAIKKSAEAKQKSYKIYTKALGTNPLDEILTRNSKVFPEPSEIEMEVLWYARPQELKINVAQNKDPALILKWKRPYLVHQWDEDVIPIEELLIDALDP